MVAAVRGVPRGPDLDVQVIVRSLRCVAGTIFRRSVKMDGLHYVVGAQPLVYAPDSHYVVKAESPCGVKRQAWYPGSCVARPRTEPAGDYRRVWLCGSLPAKLLHGCVAWPCAWRLGGCSELVPSFEELVTVEGHCCGCHVKHLHHFLYVVLMRMSFELVKEDRVCLLDLVARFLRCVAWRVA